MSDEEEYVRLMEDEIKNMQEEQDKPIERDIVRVVNRHLLAIVTKSIIKQVDGTYNIRIVNMDTDLLKDILFLFHYKHEHSNTHVLSKRRIKIFDMIVNLFIDASLDPSQLQHVSMFKQTWIVLLRGICENDVVKICKQVMDMIV
jgi:hypothetical protein